MFVWLSICVKLFYSFSRDEASWVTHTTPVVQQSLYVHEEADWGEGRWGLQPPPLPTHTQTHTPMKMINFDFSCLLIKQLNNPLFLIIMYPPLLWLSDICHVTDGVILHKNPSLSTTWCYYHVAYDIIIHVTERKARMTLQIRWVFMMTWGGIRDILPPFYDSFFIFVISNFLVCVPSPHPPPF